MKNYSNAEIKQFFAVARKLKKYCNDRVDTVLEDGDDACKDCPFFEKRPLRFFLRARRMEGVKMNIVLAIHPRHAENILNGSKKFEFRKTRAHKIYTHEKIYLYATSPIKKVVGEVRLERMVLDTREHIWNETKNFAGISHDEFLEYFKNREWVFAYKLSNPIRYKKPMPLGCYTAKKPPQSFCYTIIDAILGGN